MKKFLTNNLALKILSVVIAVAIWYMVVEVSNPYTRKTYNVPVQILNESYIVSGKTTFRIDDQYRNLKVTVEANQSALKNLDASMIRLTADLTEIVNPEATTVYVPVQVAIDAQGIDLKNVTLSRQTIQVIIENIETTVFDIEADYGSTKPGDNYEVGTISLNKDTINISGPESIVNIIGRVVAQIDVSDMKRDGVKDADLVIYDKNGSEFTEKTMDYLTFDNGNTPQLEASIALWRKRENVKLKAEYSGKVAAGYQVGEVVVTPSEVTVVGSTEALKMLDENDNTITIPGKLINIDGASEDKNDFSVDLMKDEVLDETQIRVAENTSAIKVMVTVLPMGSKVFHFDVEKIKTAGLGKNLTVSYDQPTISVRVKASDEQLDSFLPNSMVQASVSLDGKDEGDYKVTVNVTLPDGYELVEQIETTVHIKKKAEGARASKS